MIIGTLIRCADVNERRIAFYQSIGLEAVQIAGVYEDWLSPMDAARKKSDEMLALFRKYGISVPSMFLSFPNQDWSNPREGVGIVPAKKRVERMLLSCRQMNWGKSFGIKYITCHVGFLPENGTEGYAELVSDLKQLVRFAAGNGQSFLFETGTESVAELKKVLNAIDEPNLGINFDPANLLIYNQDEPSVLLDTMIDRVKVVHCKDAIRPKPGEIGGHETVLGQGATHFSELLKRLVTNGFTGPLIIERELPFGPEQEKDVTVAVQLIKNIIKGA